MNTDENGGVSVQFEPGEVAPAEEWPLHFSVRDHRELGAPTHRTPDLVPSNFITRSAGVIQGGLRGPIELREERHLYDRRIQGWLCLLATSGSTCGGNMPARHAVLVCGSSGRDPTLTELETDEDKRSHDTQEAHDLPDSAKRASGHGGSRLGESVGELQRPRASAAHHHADPGCEVQAEQPSAPCWKAWSGPTKQGRA